MVGPTTLSELVKDSDHVVVAVVRAVQRRERNWEAMADVHEVWKGPITSVVTYNVTPTFRCDMSGAVVGEEVVLFLAREDADGDPRIAHFGRGRFPIQHRDGVRFAACWCEIVMPPDLERIPVPRLPVVGSAVDLETLKTLVAREVGGRT